MRIELAPVRPRVRGPGGPRGSSGARGGGFTLVELLVVIGIIAVLLGFLLPSLGAARAQSRAVACLSNLRQISTAALMYAQETKWFVSYVPPVNGQPARDRKELLWPYLRQGRNNSDNYAAQVWTCPSNERVDVEASYGFNTNLNGVRLNKIRRWSETVEVCDGGLKGSPFAGAPGTATHVWPPSATDPKGTACRPNHLRHPKKTVCVGFVDGHGERVELKPPFYPDIVGKWTGNDITDPNNPNYKDQLWDLQ
jgi:prepilin-type N-terminal cleavage/methylation domain-containing protein